MYLIILQKHLNYILYGPSDTVIQSNKSATKKTKWRAQQQGR